MKNKVLLSFAVVIIALAVLGFMWPGAYWFFLIVIPIVAIGSYDLFQTSHSILRNFPVVGHMRFILESIRPELYQLFCRKRH